MDPKDSAQKAVECLPFMIDNPACFGDYLCGNRECEANCEFREDCRWSSDELEDCVALIGMKKHLIGAYDKVPARINTSLKPLCRTCRELASMDALRHYKI